MIEKLIQLPTREKVGLAVSLLLVALLVTDRWVVRPRVRHLRELDVAIEIEAGRIDQYRRLLAYETSVNTQYGDVKDLIGISRTEQEAIEAFKNEMDEMALRNGVRLRSMRHLTPERTAFLVTYLIEISNFEAEAVALINLLHSIGEAPGLIRVRTLTVNSQRTDTEVSGVLLLTKVMTLAGDEDMQ